MSETSPVAAATNLREHALIALVLLAAEAGAFALLEAAALHLAPAGMRERIERWLRVW
jgi:hypothetical protein